MRRLLLVFASMFVFAQPAISAGEQGAAKAREAAALLARGDTAGALALYTEALADPGLTNDRRAAIYVDRGVVHGRLNSPKLALDDFNRAILAFPENPVVYNNRGSTLLALGVPREALRDFDRAIALAPGYVAAYNNRAAARVRLGLTAEAISDYTKAIELAPQSPAPLGGRGRAHLADQRPHAALRDFNRAVAADERFAPGYRARAEAKLAIHRFEDAAEDLSRAAAFDAGNAEILLLRGRAYLLAGNAAAAVKDFSRAIEMRPTRAEPYVLRGYAHARGQAFDLAEADLVKALDLDPRSALAYTYRAWLFKQMGQPEAASREIDKAGKLEPGRAEVLWVRGEIAEALGRTQEAIGHHTKALAADPASREAAEALERLGARTDEDEAVLDGGLDPWRVVRRGTTYFAVSPQYPRLRVPLEMMGSGQPRLLEWSLRPPPYTGIGLLRFDSGSANGAQSTEQIAILDLSANAIVGIQPHRQGDRTASWRWEDGRVVVASVDGVQDEFFLRQPIRAPQPSDRRVATNPNNQVPAWAPWAQQQGYTGPGSQQPRRPSGQSKPKTLFDLLLGN